MRLPTVQRISTAGMSEERWHEVRRQGIGGSDAAAAAGVSSWKTALELYLEKRGGSCSREETEAMAWGKILEDVIARETARRIPGVKVKACNAILIRKDAPHMLANLDRVLYAPKWGRGPGVLECKTTGSHMAKEWGPNDTDQVPQEYLIQVQHYMAVTGFTWAIMAVLIGGRELRTYRFTHNPEFQGVLEELEAKFWKEHVLAGNPPEPDFNHRTTPELLKRLYHGTDGSVTDLSALEGDHRQILDLKQDLKQVEQSINYHQAKILAGMGSASIGLLPDGSGYTRRVVAAQSYHVDKAAYVMLRHSKKPRGS